MSRILCQHFATETRDAARSYARDFAALSHDQLNHSVGGVARSAYDFTEEVIIVNHHMAARLRGVEPDPWTHEGWITAPEAHKNPEKMHARLQESAEAVAAALDALDDEGLEATYTSNGKEGKLRAIAGIPAYHMGYHDGQLNLIQAALGDGEMHWSE